MPSHIVVNGLGLTYKNTIGVSMATIPDVCKTPSPGGPVPIPYPNFANQATLKKGTKTVKAKSQMIAVKGSQYGMSNGDEAGVAGGVKSSVNMKNTDWITYSFDVKMDGKNACRHTDKKFHNKQNTVDLQGNIDPQTGKKFVHICGDVGKYGTMCNQKRTARKFERDHVPAKAQLKARAAKKKKFKALSAAGQKCVKDAVTYRGMAIAIPKPVHRGFSVTCGGNNTAAQIASDAASKQSMKDAVDRDLKAIQDHLDDKAEKSGDPDDKACAAAYKAASETVKNHDTEKMIDDAIVDCKAKYG